MDTPDLQLNIPPHTHKILYTVIAILSIVVIAGSVYWWKEIKQTPGTQNICVAGTKPEDCDDTINQNDEWKSYSDNIYGFEFEHPSSWQVADHSLVGPPTQRETIYLNSPANVEVWDEIKSGRMYGEGFMDDLRIRYFTSDKSLDQFVAQKITQQETVEPKKITFAGFPAYEFTTGGFGTYYTIITDRNGMFFEFLFGNKATKADLSADENRILESFNFELDTAQWRTFDNKELGISFRYPPELGDITFQIANGESYDYADHPETVKGKTFGGYYKWLGADNRFYLLTGISPDFQTNREGKFTDTQGYVKEGDKYYFLSAVDSKHELDSKYVTEIQAANATGIFLEPHPFPDDLYKFQPYVNAFGAIFNLKSAKDFKGVAFYYVAPNAQNEPKLLNTFRPVFQKMMESVSIY